MSNVAALQAALREEIRAEVPDAQQTWEGQGLPVQGRWINLRPIEEPSLLAGAQRDNEDTRLEATDATLTLAPPDAGAGAAITLQGFSFFGESLEVIRDQIDVWCEGVTTALGAGTLTLSGALWGLRALSPSRTAITVNSRQLYRRLTQHRVWSLAVDSYVAPTPGDVATSAETNATDIGRRIQKRFQQRAVLERLESRTVVVLHPLGALSNTSGIMGPQWNSSSSFVLRCLQTFKDFTATTPIDSATTDVTIEEG